MRLVVENRRLLSLVLQHFSVRRCVIRIIFLLIYSICFRPRKMTVSLDWSKIVWHFATILRNTSLRLLLFLLENLRLSANTWKNCVFSRSNKFLLLHHLNLWFFSFLNHLRKVFSSGLTAIIIVGVTLVCFRVWAVKFGQFLKLLLHWWTILFLFFEILLILFLFQLS